MVSHRLRFVFLPLSQLTGSREKMREEEEEQTANQRWWPEVAWLAVDSGGGGL
ncbi:hypothetical protein CsatA_025332 [Cannabis sativa]